MVLACVFSRGAVAPGMDDQIPHGTCTRNANVKEPVQLQMRVARLVALRCKIEVMGAHTTMRNWPAVRRPPIPGFTFS